MGTGQLDLKALTFKDYVIGAVYAVLGTMMVTGLETMLKLDLPSLVASAAGAAIGIAAWFIYLLKRKS